MHLRLRQVRYVLFLTSPPWSAKLIRLSKFVLHGLTSVFGLRPPPKQTEARVSVPMIRDAHFLTPKLLFQDPLTPTHKISNRQTSNWVGDDKRIPGAVCFFAFILLGPSSSVLQNPNEVRSLSPTWKL